MPMNMRKVFRTLPDKNITFPLIKIYKLFLCQLTCKSPLNAIELLILSW